MEKVGCYPSVDPIVSMINARNREFGHAPCVRSPRTGPTTSQGDLGWNPVTASTPATGRTGSPVRRIRTFHARRNRITPTQASALARYRDQWLLLVDGQLLDLPWIFGNTHPIVLEIGFGMGDATAQLAEREPDANVLAVDVHTPGVGQLLDHIGRRNLTNVRVMQGDAVEVVTSMLPPSSLAGVRIFFPDPWPKVRHRKRRLVQPEFVALLTTRLQPGGYLHCATDWEPYGEQMLAVVEAEPGLANAHGGYAPRPQARPTTKFEQRGLARGHRVVDVIATRTLGA
jgi:tRNA (guanine-N7-)-methyltransferase